MLRRLERRLQRLIKKAVAGFVGAVFLIVGAAFLTTAAWIGLAHVTNHGIAALILGGLWVIVGVIAMGIATKREKPDPRDLQPDPTLAMASAFLSGFTAAKKRN